MLGSRNADEAPAPTMNTRRSLSGTFDGMSRTLPVGTPRAYNNRGPMPGISSHIATSIAHAPSSGSGPAISRCGRPSRSIRADGPVDATPPSSQEHVLQSWQFLDAVGGIGEDVGDRRFSLLLGLAAARAQSRSQVAPRSTRFRSRPDPTPVAHETGVGSRGGGGVSRRSCARRTRARAVAGGSR